MSRFSLPPVASSAIRQPQGNPLFPTLNAQHIPAVTTTAPTGPSQLASAASDKMFLRDAALPVLAEQSTAALEDAGSVRFATKDAMAQQALDFNA